ncbi:hypothetical protein D187_002640 [Cystobacter fuscus DSM 2262]|uniref:Lipoprotein n=1 Tax=Cystobacter fuscus (strain ATCC 25194 / DSM 2262 / NBRC 100088 / M29) TaxID=1242864 RepID=S9P9S7_CYSF2|nr:hypothetical protein [Cystobacter fuscus]EPX59896.1 hypothetical protein D187_002640 [Cystobacter fuscus DSM 2262]
MPRYVWVLGGLVWWTACPGNGGLGGEDAGGVPPEQRNRELRACILQRLPPAEATATEWKVSGYVLVDAYVKCQREREPEQATAADFRSVVRELAELDADTSLVRIIVPPGEGAP